MNMLTEDQAAERRLALPATGLLDGLSPQFIAELQSRGAFVEYNQQAIIASGALAEYVCCIVAGRVKISRVDADYVKAPVAMLGVGEWFGETNLFVRLPSPEEIYADGEVVVWTMPPDTLRRLFFDNPEATPLLFNIGASLAQKLAARSR